MRERNKQIDRSLRTFHLRDQLIELINDRYNFGSNKKQEVTATTTIVCYRKKLSHALNLRFKRLFSVKKLSSMSVRVCVCI